MMIYFVLAWRNLWRNKQRTLITTGSIFFAVILVLFTRSMQLGSYKHIIANTLQLSTGYVQIQGNGFWDKRSLNNSMEVVDSLFEKVSAIPHITHTVPRIQSFALGSSGDNSRGVIVQAIAPGEENRMSGLSRYVEKGKYLEPESQGIMIGEKLSEYLSITVGDSLILISQGYRGQSAAGIFPVHGIVSMPAPDLDRSIVYMPLKQAQWFFSMPQRITSLVIMIDDPDNLNSVESALRELFGSQYTVMNWRQMLPELVQSIEIDNAGGIIMLGILYIVIGFGVFGTIMMMMMERKREFAILLSVGMKRWRINYMLFLETIMIGLLGTLAGAAVSVPLLLFMRAHPIRLTGQAAEAMREYGFEPLLPFLVEPSIFLNQTITVLSISIIASLYPLWSVYRLKISKTLHA